MWLSMENDDNAPRDIPVIEWLLEAYLLAEEIVKRIKEEIQAKKDGKLAESG